MNQAIPPAHAVRAFALPAPSQDHGSTVAQRRAFAGGTLWRAPIPGWVAWQLALPLTLFALANAWLLGLQGDLWLASHLYAWEGGQWALRDGVLTRSIIHVGGKRASTLAWLLVVTLLAIAWRRPALVAWRRPLACLALSVLVSTVLVAWLKHVTAMDCPWDANVFGGRHPYFDLFDAHPANLRASGCFPAGHASAGYAWVALYFFFSCTHRAWRWNGLAVGLVAGLVFGFSQQLRGAHYLSHDVWTLMLCWLVALAVHRLSIRSSSRAAFGTPRRGAAFSAADTEVAR